MFFWGGFRSHRMFWKKGRHHKRGKVAVVFLKSVLPPTANPFVRGENVLPYSFIIIVENENFEPCRMTEEIQKEIWQFVLGQHSSLWCDPAV